MTTEVTKTIVVTKTTIMATMTTGTITVTVATSEGHQGASGEGGEVITTMGDSSGGIGDFGAGHHWRTELAAN